MTRIRITVDLPVALVGDVQRLLMRLVDVRAPARSKILTIEHLLTVLLEDAAAAIERPPSPGGAAMTEVMATHGYIIRSDDEPKPQGNTPSGKSNRDEASRNQGGEE